MTISGDTIKYSSVKNRKKLEEENKLEQEINKLEAEINDFSSIDENKITNFAQKRNLN